MKLLVIGCWLLVVSVSMAGSANAALFDVEKRRDELSQKRFGNAKNACLAGDIALEQSPKPILSLKTTKGYGSDNSSEGFAWYLMVNSGRALADDKAAENKVISALKDWARAGAFSNSDDAHDTYYALKRVMIPVVVSYDIVQESIGSSDKKIISSWIDGLVRKLDKKFNGIVDVNNHRYLADSLLMAWGAIIDDDELYNKGINRFKQVLVEANPDGSLMLEVRRGSRAVWYMRHALSSLTMMAEIAKTQGDDLYGVNVDGKSLDTIMSYYLTAVNNPLTILPAAAENYIPGKNNDYLEQYMGMLELRKNNQHYMAFGEAWIAKNIADNKSLNSLTLYRIASLMARDSIAKKSPIN